MRIRELAFLAAVPLLAAGLTAGWRGLVGYALGAGGAALNLWAWWLLLGVLGSAVAQARNAKGATSVVVLSFLLKAPILFALVFGARRLGADAALWCVAGVVLVYSLLVVWALGRS